ncbi:MAG: radical SAM protein, partial [Planctomycetota bacterium]
GLGIGARRITVSTVGIPDGIRKLADLRLQINLAISLHAADEEKRKKLIPIAKRHGLQDVIEAAEYYRHKTTRDVTFEILLMRGMNDGPEDAEAAVSLLKGRKCTVNLIPFNAISGSYFNPPSTQSLSEFRSILETAHIPVTVRKSRGTDIFAACGQLRLSRIEDPT